MPRDDLGLILDTLRTPSPYGKEGPNAMETLALASYEPGDKFKHVVVNMRGLNANTLVIVGTVKLALKRAGANPAELFLFVGNALSNNYEHALATICEWVTVTDEPLKSKEDAWSSMLEIAGRERAEESSG